MRPPRLSLGNWFTHTAAVVLADATTILLAAPAMSFKLTMGMSPFSSAPGGTLHGVNASVSGVISQRTV